MIDKNEEVIRNVVVDDRKKEERHDRCKLYDSR